MFPESGVSVTKAKYPLLEFYNVLFTTLICFVFPVEFTFAHKAWTIINCLGKILLENVKHSHCCTIFNSVNTSCFEKKHIQNIYLITHVHVFIFRTPSSRFSFSSFEWSLIKLLFSGMKTYHKLTCKKDSHICVHFYIEKFYNFKKSLHITFG